MPRAVRFACYGDVEVLEVVEVPRPEPGPGQVLVAVRAAGTNPGEMAIREGKLHERWPATFPSGQGSDLAGSVARVGEGIAEFAEGDDVLGYTDDRAAQADFVVTETTRLVHKPGSVSWPVAGALKVAGTTAWAATRVVEPREGEVVVVSAAAGGVGCLAGQLARLHDARVIGLAGPDHHMWLRGRGIEPVDYHRSDLVEALGALHGRVDAFLDCFGAGYVDLALQLDVPPERINTTADFAATEKHGVRAVGEAEASDPEVLSRLAELLGAGRLELPIAATYPLERVRDAYTDLGGRHTLGKIVLDLDAKDQR